MLRLSNAVMRGTLLAEPDPEVAVYDLIEKANDAGGRDNVTVVLAKVLDRGAVSYGRAAAS